MITALEFIVMDGDSPPINITLDPNNKVGEKQLFLLDQEGAILYASLAQMQDLAKSARQLALGLCQRKIEYTKDHE